MPNEDKEFIKSRLRDSAFTSFRSYNCNSEINLTKIEQLILNNLSNNKNIIIQKFDKGNNVVLLDKDKYLEESAISDHLLTCDCVINFNDFIILSKDSNNFNLLIKESLLIARDEPILNKTVKSFPLELFK